MGKGSCKKCKGTGSRFIKLYDTAIGAYGVKRNKKGKLGKWIMCKYCIGTGNSPKPEES